MVLTMFIAPTFSSLNSVMMNKRTQVAVAASLNPKSVYSAIDIFK